MSVTRISVNGLRNKPVLWDRHREKDLLDALGFATPEPFVTLKNELGSWPWTSLAFCAGAISDMSLEPAISHEKGENVYVTCLWDNPGIGLGFG